MYKFHAPTKKVQKGFTLMEVVLYMAFTTIALLLAGGFMLQILSVKANLHATGEVYQQAHFALQEITARILDSTRVVSPLPGETSSELVLEEGSSSPTTFFLDAGILLETHGSSTLPLTTSEVSVVGIEFMNVAYPSGPDAVRALITVRYVNPSGSRAYEVEEVFHTARAIRITP